MCVAREWWKTGINYQGLQLTNNSIKYGTILALMVANSASTFQLTGKEESQKFKGKTRCKSVEKYICIIYIKVYLQNFQLLQKEVNSKPLNIQKRALLDMWYKQN